MQKHSHHIQPTLKEINPCLPWWYNEIGQNLINLIQRHIYLWLFYASYSKNKEQKLEGYFKNQAYHDALISKDIQNYKSTEILIHALWHYKTYYLNRS